MTDSGSIRGPMISRDGVPHVQRTRLTPARGQPDDRWPLGHVTRRPVTLKAINREEEATARRGEEYSDRLDCLARQSTNRLYVYAQSCLSVTQCRLLVKSL